MVNYITISLPDEGYFITINDIADEGNFTWTTNDNGTIPVTYSDWNTNQPNDNLGKEDCGEIRRSIHYHWNDRSCSDKIAFICMKALAMPNC